MTHVVALPSRSSRVQNVRYYFPRTRAASAMRRAGRPQTIPAIHAGKHDDSALGRIASGFRTAGGIEAHL